ncbi:MAG: DUF2779 domain-containing protein [Coriobacteriia bacterium]|nr:DUF2779 domain-containing protein [Coriobacteriia bacterium]
MNLSKSRYTKGIQCPKMLWMESHMKEWFDESVLNQAILETGNQVGDLAMGYYGDFVEVPFTLTGKNQMVEDTQEFLRQALEGTGPVNIAEATFAYDGNLCMVDILRVEPDGVRIVEVKSSTHVNDIYYHDMAFQTWLLGKCGMNVKSVSLMHLNSQYVRSGDLDLQQLFVPEDCTEQVMVMVPQVEGTVAALKDCADGDAEPEQPIGCQCNNPYECGYKNWCWRDVPPQSVFELNRLRKQKAFDLYHDGVVTLKQLAEESGISLTERQQVQVDCAAQGLDAVIDRHAVADFLAGMEFPLYFLDFETFQPAVPPFDGVKPYQQIPTQYSLHVQREPHGELEHYEFLADAVGDPRRAVAEHLVEHIPGDGTTLAYNMSFEKGRIAELANAFPDLEEQLLAINQGMQDLIVPFSKGWYFLPVMGGSASIKKVLPALYPDDPELDYGQLEGVHNGSQAMAAFADLATMDPEQAARTREQLLRYCELDTLAMVKIWQRLVEVAAA